ncbi:Druantia anti-phage system protein DruA [Plantactinospora sp. CA-294935]|uniref:Druantia anti-phage system protein DruA n=1 Tax=Plantactinospora sp. CA-294935 TaxID=3240012 RepID=UPI003D8D5388
MIEMWYSLPCPPGCQPAERRAFAALGDALATDDASARQAARERCLAKDNAALTAATHVLIDLVGQGWNVRVDDHEMAIAPPLGVADPVEEKSRVRRQELIKRDEQLSNPSVRRFIAAMEKPREFEGKFVSIFSLMRDGKELSTALQTLEIDGDADLARLRGVIDPYVQVVSSNERCPQTGFRLMDIWRYFRHTWSNQYTSTPGRTMMILIRDRAASFHPVIGIAALGSAVVQLAERDDWIGWQPAVFLENLLAAPTLRMARWITARLQTALEELYVDDLVKDGLYWPSLWESPASDAIERLLKEAETRRRDHHRFVKATDFKKVHDADDVKSWRRRAESDLFRSKRCLALADLLSARQALAPYLYPKASRTGLSDALGSPKARRAIMSVLRRAKADAVGTEIADLTVCGAVAPYNALLGGKLVSMLAVSPTVVKAYHRRYSTYASEIASSMAGRPIRRRSNLVFVGTTSLYGSGASQYNRIRIPPEVLGGLSPIEFRQLGRSKSFGTSHLSAESVRALVRLAEQTAHGARVNSIFGEGVNPKFRKVRHGFDLLQWPSDTLLQHGRQRIIYGISLVDNLLPYLLGSDAEPSYKFRRRKSTADVEAISAWWMRRWCHPRSKSPAVLEAVAEHRLTRPVRHGARVTLPNLPLAASEHEQLELY